VNSNIMDRLASSAALLPPEERADFVKSVLNRICHQPRVEFEQLDSEIRFVLSTRGVMMGTRT
jgi:hypothetical protein